MVWIAERLKFIQVAEGPRQVGKTSMIRLASFSKRYQPHKTLIVGTNGISIEEFLRMSPNDLFLNGVFNGRLYVEWK